MALAPAILAGAFTLKLAKETLEWLFSPLDKPPPPLTEEAKQFASLAERRFGDIKMGSDVRSQVLGMFQAMSDTASAAEDASILQKLRADKVRACLRACVLACHALRAA